MNIEYLTPEGLKKSIHNLDTVIDQLGDFSGNLKGLLVEVRLFLSPEGGRMNNDQLYITFINCRFTTTQLDILIYSNLYGDRKKVAFKMGISEHGVKNSIHMLLKKIDEENIPSIIKKYGFILNNLNPIRKITQ